MLFMTWDSPDSLDLLHIGPLRALWNITRWPHLKHRFQGDEQYTTIHTLPCIVGIVQPGVQMAITNVVAIDSTKGLQQTSPPEHSVVDERDSKIK